MPQLDTFTFTSQAFWFSTLFLIFYFLILNNFLVFIFKVLRVRSFLLDSYASSLVNFFKENFLFSKFGFFNLKEELSLTKKFFSDLSSDFTSWFSLKRK